MLITKLYALLPNVPILPTINNKPYITPNPYTTAVSIKLNQCLTNGNGIKNIHNI